MKIMKQMKFIIRGLIRDKLNTIIIVSGLALGIAVCLLIGLYVDNELQYDKHQADYHKIFRVVSTVGMGD
ncbi:MAG: hypothetical protein MI922_12820, partial [Bacteroidales bacterium]|nr:hypothetical protein [Bacteroidales bacterium]